MINSERDPGHQKLNVVFLIILMKKQVGFTILYFRNNNGYGRSGFSRSGMTEEKLRAYKQIKKQSLLKSIKKVMYRLLSRQEMLFLLSFRNGNMYPIGN